MILRILTELRKNKVLKLKSVFDPWKNLDTSDPKNLRVGSGKSLGLGDRGDGKGEV